MKGGDMFRSVKTVVAMSVVLTLTAGVTTVARADDDPTSSDPPPSVVTEAPAPETTIKIVVNTEPATTSAPETDPPTTERHDTPISTDPSQPQDTTVITIDPRESDGTLGNSTTVPETTVKSPVDNNPDSDPCSWRPSCPWPPVDTDASTTTTAAPDSVPAVVTTTTNVQVTHNQDTVITGTQVSGSNSGGNNIDAGGNTPGGATVPSGSIDTGDAAAIGSMDQNTILQQAQIALTDQAVANLLQIALILNIGAGFANTGLNNVSASPSGDGVTGQVGTGNATAVGNDLAAYVTQAANANANSALNDDTSQTALSLFLGLAVANSGLNGVTGDGTTGSGGSVGSGDATAIGNNSITGITQLATLMGADAAKLTVQQRATVLNLGFALANSGLNDVAGVAGSLLAAGDEEDDALALQLFTMLLPALLQSFGYGGCGCTTNGGAGSIGTGNASATGNQSNTQILQQAGATATGDGEINMSQDVLVANMGGAAANTGANAIGSARTLDPQTASAVVQMAAFLSKMLSIVHHNSDAANTLATADQTMEIPFGDLILTVEGAISGLDQQFRFGEAQANTRQISVVISLGVAQANSGLNTTAVLSDTNLLAAVNSVLPQLVQTGDADAANKTLVVICQRIDADNVECLKPPPPPPDTPDETTTTTTAPPTEGTIIDGPIIATPVSDPYATGSTTWIDDGVKTSGTEVPPLSGLMTAKQTGPLPSTGSDPMLPMEMGGILIFVGLVFLAIRRKAVPRSQ